MSHLSQIGLMIARIIVASFGFLLAYVALFLHEDEEGKLQNRLEELWVRIYDLRGSALSKETIFLKEVLNLLGRGFDTLLGGELLSLRSITVTTCYSLASVFFVLTYVLVPIGYIMGGSPTFSDYIPGLCIAAGFLVYGTLSIAIREHISLRIWVGVIVVLLMISTLIIFSEDGSLTEIGQSWLIVVVGSSCDLVFVAINRIIFRVGAQLNKSGQIAILLAANIAVSVLYLGPVLYWLVVRSHVPDSNIIYEFIFWLSSTNLITSLFALSIVFMMLTMLCHRLFWPFIERPLYAIVRHSLVNKPTGLLSCSILLLTWAVPAWRPFWELVGKLK